MPSVLICPICGSSDVNPSKRRKTDLCKPCDKLRPENDPQFTKWGKSAMKSVLPALRAVLDDYQARLPYSTTEGGVEEMSVYMSALLESECAYRAYALRHKLRRERK